MTSSRITIFCGRFGSGKTEIALNYAVRLADQGTSPLLIDLDIVTPYFRCREQAEEMARHDVTVVSPFIAGHYIDMPAISPSILGAIEQQARPVVIDLGGDEQGARAIAQYEQAVNRHGYTLNLVVNPYRPFMDTVPGIQSALQEIQASSRLNVSALVSNPNLMSESTPTLFMQGHRLVREVAREQGLPISFAVMSESLFDKWLAAQPSLFTGTPHSRMFAATILDPVNHQALPVLVIHRFFLMFDQP